MPLERWYEARVRHHRGKRPQKAIHELSMEIGTEMIGQVLARRNQRLGVKSRLRPFQGLERRLQSLDFS